MLKQLFASRLDKLPLATSTLVNNSNIFSEIPGATIGVLKLLYERETYFLNHFCSLNYILPWFYKLSENATWTTRVEGGGLKKRRWKNKEGKRNKGKWGATWRKVSSCPLEHVLVELEFDGSWTLKTPLSVCCKVWTLNNIENRKNNHYTAVNCVKVNFEIVNYHGSIIRFLDFYWPLNDGQTKSIGSVGTWRSCVTLNLLEMIQ